MNGNDVRINARIPATLKDLIREFIKKTAHLNESDFIRDAIGEKIQERETPEFCRELFRVEKGRTSEQTEV